MEAVAFEATQTLGKYMVPLTECFYSWSDMKERLGADMYTFSLLERQVRNLYPFQPNSVYDRSEFEYTTIYIARGPRQRSPSVILFSLDRGDVFCLFMSAVFFDPLKQAGPVIFYLSLGPL